MNYPEEGEQYWLVHEGYAIIIRVTVTGKDTYGDFWVDEPTGNSVEAGCLFDDVEEAADLLLSNVGDAQEIWNDEYPESGPLVLDENYSLDDYRSAQIDWISWQQQDVGVPANRSILTMEWPDKDREDWMNLRQVREMRGTPRNEFEELYMDD